MGLERDTQLLLLSKIEDLASDPRPSQRYHRSSGGSRRG